MSDQLTQLMEQMNQALTDMRSIDQKIDARVQAGLSNAVKQEELAAATTAATKAANAVEELERKMLASPARHTLITPEAQRKSELAAQCALVGQYYLSGDRDAYNGKLHELAMATDNSTGSFVIAPPTMADGVLEMLTTFSAMEQVCDVETIDGTVWERTKQTGRASAGRVSERGTRSETTTPTFGKDRIGTDGYYWYPTVTQEQLAMTKDFDLGAFVMNDGNYEIQALAEADYLTGDGVNDKPNGLLANTTLQAAAKITSDADGLGVSFDPLANMTGAIHESFLPNARWMMRRATLVAITLLKKGTGEYLLWLDPTGSAPDRLSGFPIAYNGYFPAVSDYATNPYPVAFGDFRQYKIIHSRFMLLLRDEITSPGYVKMYKEVKKGGNVRRTEAFSFLKITAA